MMEDPTTEFWSEGGAPVVAPWHHWGSDASIPRGGCTWNVFRRYIPLFQIDSICLLYNQSHINCIYVYVFICPDMPSLFLLVG